MTRLKHRIEALESRNGVGIARWHLVTQRIGQTEEEARTLYETANGPIGADEGIILLQIVAPGDISCHA